MGPYNKDPTIWGTILGSPIFGNSNTETLQGTLGANPFKRTLNINPLKKTSKGILLKAKIGSRVTNHTARVEGLRISALGFPVGKLTNASC